MLLSVCRSAEKYGALASALSLALRSFEDATSSIAFVICIVFWMLLIRSLTDFIFAAAIVSSC